LPSFFRALAKEENETLRDYVLLSLFTGARQANVLGMKWEEIDFRGGVWHIPETKNGTPHLIPLTSESMAILRRRKDQANTLDEFVLATTNKLGHLSHPKTGWKRILKRAGIKNLRMHDLRRTLGSWQAATGASLTVIGKTLNHKSPTSTAIYARLTLEPVRTAVDTATKAILAAASLVGETIAENSALELPQGAASSTGVNNHQLVPA
jgi:integrase